MLVHIPIYPIIESSKSFFLILPIEQIGLSILSQLYIGAVMVLGYSIFFYLNPGILF